MSTLRSSSDYQSQPTSLRQLREFLGLVNFYHRFIPRCAEILTPLNELLKATSSNSRAIQWNSDPTTAFQNIKDALANAVKCHTLSPP